MGDVSRRGVYYDLKKSPYEYKTPYGDLLKFSSKKKLEIYSRDIPKQIKRLDDLIVRYELEEFIPKEIYTLLVRGVHQSFYRKVEN